MRVAELRCDEDTKLHIWSRHRVSYEEVEEAAFLRPLVFRGREKGLYGIHGRTETGRYIVLFVRKLGKGVARLITARDMSQTERRRYAKYMAH